MTLKGFTERFKEQEVKYIYELISEHGGSKDVW